MIRTYVLFLTCLVFAIDTVSALPVTDWQQQYGINLVGAGTDSPLVGQDGSDDGGQCILWASFEDVVLENVGDSINLSFSWKLTGSNSSSDFFRYGLFDVNDSSTQGNWLGYKASNVGVFEQSGTGNGDFGSTSSARGSYVSGANTVVSGTGGQDGTYKYNLIIVKVNGGLKICSQICGDNGYSYSTSVVDTTPQSENTPILYNRVGLVQTGSAAPDLVEFFDIDVSSFTSIVVNPDPANFSRGVEPDSIFGWDNLDDRFINYDVYIRANEPDFIPVNNNKDSYCSLQQSANIFEPAVKLALNTEYFWRVDAYVDTEESEPVLIQGPIWSFKTRSEYDYGNRSVADFNRDAVVNIADLALFLDDWLLPYNQRIWKADRYGPGTDINDDCSVNLLDFSHLSLAWDTTQDVMPLPQMYYAYDYGDRIWAKDPDVISWNGKYYMYCSALNGNLGIAIVESTDLIYWRQIALLPADTSYEAKGHGAPCAVILKGQVHLFYQTYGNGAGDAICHAWSDDGINFTKNADNPIFHPAVSDWTCGRAIDADVIENDGTVYLYYATRDTSYSIQKIGLATAPLNSNFDKSSWTEAAAHSVFKPEAAWEKKCIEAPAVLFRSDLFYMFYAGAYNAQSQQIGVAVSVDGVDWHRLSESPILPAGQVGQWNSGESGHPGVFTDDNGDMYLFFQGTNDGGASYFLSKMKIEWDGMLPYLVNPGDEREYHLDNPIQFQ